MLNIITEQNKAIRCLIALLLFISCITFQKTVSAEDIKEKTAEEYRVLGYMEQEKGNLNEALSYYTKAISLGLKSAVVLNDMGVLYEDIDLYGRAEKFYLDAIQTDPRYLPPYNNLAYLYQRLGKRKEAVEYFRRRFELGEPADPWAQKAKEELLKLDPSYKDWAISVEAAAFNRELTIQSQEEFYQRVKRGQEHYKRGIDLFDADDFNGALKEYDQALQYLPKNPKIIDARKQTLIEITKKNVKEQSEQAIKMLDAGDTRSAQYEIEKMLTTIPNEPIMVSPQYAR